MGFLEVWRYNDNLDGWANTNCISKLKENGKITNSEYQSLNNVSRETATRDLKELIDRKILKPSGQNGAGAFYTIK